MMLALPIDPRPASGAEMLDIMLGMVVRCEVVDSFGWAFGTIVAPSSAAGRRGCFQCEGMRPCVAVLLPRRCGDALELRPGVWEALEQMPTPTMHERLRRKALLNRIEKVRAAWNRHRPSA